MSFLKTLTFSSANELTPSPIEKKRLSLVNKLRDQLELIDNPSLTRSSNKWVKSDGDRVLQQIKIIVRPWWKETSDGKVMFYVRSGLRKIEFEKDKQAIVIESMDELPKIIRGLVDAVKIGELDHLLMTGQKTISLPRKKAA